MKFALIAIAVALTAAAQSTPEWLLGAADAQPPAAAAPERIALPDIGIATLDWISKPPTLVWAAVPGATSYEIQRWKVKGAGGKADAWKTQGYATVLAWSDPRPPRKPAYYRVRAIQAGFPQPVYSRWIEPMLYPGE